MSPTQPPTTPEGATDNPGPWYKQFWPWFVLAIPAITIVWCIFMITVAVSSQGAMVNDDYYKEGLAINMELARDRLAADRGLAGAVQFEDNQIRMELDEAGKPVNFDFLILDMAHPTLEQQDRRLQLQRVGDGIYEASLPRPLEGRWYLELRGPTNDWRLKGEAALPASMPLKLAPAPQG
ncbi:FixH family protein [Marinobacter nanhaiticus D15-8W]|uniref:Nitrogen fixation protein FixH n=1 Tax=Marinobacter nanhaiticus D15-8W TaxID=626887 RepID=N6WRQ7_9GAMM|nr:FixH family protein [Marinobacter nanhaiticus]ENO13702.1 nitrogen fixation protein FixH [Marinobacter nanhaiticus D15-8W]BES71074.1 FixH family protein [Marinobacter nanhaiticus D15-8W]